MAGGREDRKGLTPMKLAGVLMACAGALTGLAVAIPSPMTIANALLFWAWAATAMHFARTQGDQRMCAACGAINPLKLPDGACAACAAPVRRSFPLASAEQKQPERNSDERPSTPW